jgi:hypothetical protein
MKSLSEEKALAELEKGMTEWYNEYFCEKYALASPEPAKQLVPESERHLSTPVKQGGYYAGYVRGLHHWVR